MKSYHSSALPITAAAIWSGLGANELDDMAAPWCDLRGSRRPLQDTPPDFGSHRELLISQLGQFLPKSDVCVTSVQPQITDSCRTSRQVGSGPCVDGSELARRIFT